jgi:hypothetical protein
MPPRLQIASIDILDDARYGEVVDASRRLVLGVSFQHSIRHFRGQQVMAQCREGLFMFCCDKVFCGGVEGLLHT